MADNYLRMMDIPDTMNSHSPMSTHLTSNQKVIYTNLDVARKSDTTDYIQIFITNKLFFLKPLQTDPPS